MRTHTSFRTQASSQAFVSLVVTVLVVILLTAMVWQ